MGQPHKMYVHCEIMLCGMNLPGYHHRQSSSQEHAHYASMDKKVENKEQCGCMSHVIYLWRQSKDIGVEQRWLLTLLELRLEC